MVEAAITDWDDAYANSIHISEGNAWPGRWIEAAERFRASCPPSRMQLGLAYGAGERNRLDLFLPGAAPVGLVVFIHGGYWMAMERQSFSHLAIGPLAHGYAVAMPSYTLCPDTTIAGIGREIAGAIEFAAARIAGPIRLTGHSAGGQLVARMVTATSPLDPEIRARVAHTVPISGVHDLRPLCNVAFNAVLGLDDRACMSESPVLLKPDKGARTTCWVGADERPEFVRQNALLASIWRGLGVATETVVEPDRHHFDVIDGLSDPHSPLMRCLLE